MAPATQLQLIDERELARITRLSVRTIQRHRLVGEGIPFRKIGKAVRYDLADVEHYLEASRRTSTSDPGPAA